MNNSTITLILFIIVLVVFLFSGYRNRKNVKDENSFFFGSKKLNSLKFAINVTGTNFSFISAVFVMLLWAYMYGFSTMWAVGTGIVGIIIFAIPLIPLKTNFIDTKDTLHHYIAEGNSNLRKLSGGVTVVTLFGYLIAEAFIFCSFFSNYVPINVTFLLVIFFLIATLNACIGGYDSVIKTDYFQFSLMVIGSIALVIYVWSLQNIGEVSIVNNYRQTNFDKIPDFLIPMLILINGFSQFATMDMWQRAKATGDIKKIRKGSIIGSILFLAISISVIAIGTHFRILDAYNNQVVSDPFNILTRIVDLSAPFGFGYLMLIFFLTAFMTTLDTLFIAISHSISFDFLTTKKSKSKSRIVTIIVGGLSLLLCILLTQTKINSQNVVTVLLVLFSCQLVLVPSVLLRSMLKMKLKSGVYFLSISLGLIVSGVMTFLSVSQNNVDLQNAVPVVAFFTSLFVILITSPFYLIKEEQS